MRLTLAVLLYIFMALSAFGKGNLSTLIADKGLSHALRDLQAIPKRTFRNSGSDLSAQY